METPFACDFANHLLSMEKRINVIGNGEAAAYSPSKTEINIFACEKLSPALKIVEHEIGHFLEMSKPLRLLQYDFGIKKFLPERTNKNAFFVVLRETKVRAIQDIILGAPGSRMPCETNGIFGTFVPKDFSFGKFASKGALLEYAKDLYERTTRAWNKDRVESEWKSRLDFVRDWMES